MSKKPPKHYPRGQEPKARRQVYDRQRGSSTARGYGSAWQRYREWFLSQPENVFCKCGCGGLSEQVDHIVPVSGPDDPLFWERTNHQGLTADCHKRKTIKDNGGRIGG
jgi:5-methylcytosine-specific restriction enzyme A